MEFLKPHPSTIVIICFLVYKVTESLLQSSIRLHLYNIICASVMNTSIIGDLRRGTKSQEPSRKHICVDDVPSKFFHNASTPSDAQEESVQRHSAAYLIAYRSLLNLPAAFTCLIFGALSDEMGRKWPMIVPIVGSALAGSFFAGSLAPSLKPLPEAAILVLCGAFIYGICGKSSCWSMGANSYVTDVSSTEERTKLLGRLLGSNMLGLCLGSALLSIFSRYTNLWAILGFVGTCNILVLLVVILVMRESRAHANQPMVPQYGSTNEET